MMNALIVLSGGLAPNFKPNLPTALRCDRAAEIHHRYDLVICSSGTTYRKAGTHPLYSEAEGMRQYLMDKSVPAAKIIIEDVSKDTFSNAYYSRLLCLDPKGITKFDVVTSAFHLPRSQYVFDLVCPAPMFKVGYIAAVNPVVSTEIMRNRLYHEKMVLEFYQKHLSSTYGIIPGDMNTIGQFMKRYNPAMTGHKDLYHEELTREIAMVIDLKLDTLY